MKIKTKSLDEFKKELDLKLEEEFEKEFSGYPLTEEQIREEREKADLEIQDWEDSRGQY